LAFTVSFLRQFAICDGSNHFYDAAHLLGQVGGHHVDVVSQILPGAGDSGHLGLPAQLAFRTHFARYASYLGSESVELIHHRVDGVLEFEDFAFHIDRDFRDKSPRATAVVTSAMLRT
jgi:hypothetical protein